MLYRFRVEDGLSEAFTAADAAETFDTVSRQKLERLRPGETYTDGAGDVWVAEEIEDESKATDERLERLATAAMQGLLTSPHTRQCESAEGIALNAVAYAKALIAELDAAK